jgi:bifunctional non-homologous end joining protein LigD
LIGSGAVLVGVPGVGGLRYLGRVGSGIAGKTARALAADLAPADLRRDCPFVGCRARQRTRSGTTWVHPVLVCDVQALGLTDSRRLRQPAYRGLRPDLTPGDIDPGRVARCLSRPAPQR